MQPPQGLNCSAYLTPFADVAKGVIYNPDALSDCQYCPIANGDQFLAGSSIHYSTRWRDYGIGFVYIGFNIFMAVFLYYLIRVRKSSGKSGSEKFGWLLKPFKKDPSAEKTTTQSRAEAPLNMSPPVAAIDNGKMG